MYIGTGTSVRSKRLQFKVVGHCIAEYIRCLRSFARHFTCFKVMTVSSNLWRKESRFHCPYKFHQY